MKKICIFILIIFSVNSFSYGEISFKKQREKEVKEAEERKTQTLESNSADEKVVTKNTAKTGKERYYRKAILDTAFTQMGVPYIYGANGGGAYDCSSFVQYVYKKSLNITLPRVSYEQASFGQKASIKQLRAGDLVAFDSLNKGRISHIGIYIGNNQFIHASSGYKKVVVSELDGYYAKKFKCGVKIL